MSLRAKVRKLWRSIIPRSRSDVEEEFRFHLESYQQDLIRQDLSEKEARRKARIDLGRPATQNETYRYAIGLRAFDELGGDIRYGLRGLRRNPGFAAVAILSLALGIGATTAMFSLIYAVLLHPFPYLDADRIMNPVIINEQNPGELRWFAMWKPQFELFTKAHSIESLLGFRNMNMEITGAPLPEDVMAIYLTENADTFFGVRALLGRDIQQSDAQSHQPVVVLNYKFWQRYFNGDPHVIGRMLELNHVAHTIVGVMPRSFTFNDAIGIGDIYLPRNLLHDNVNPPVHWPYTPWIKLKPHIMLAAADAELQAIVRQFARQNPEVFPARWHLALQPIIVPFEQNTGRTLMLLLAGVVLLLIIGCANCSILLLARGRARQHELAVRTAVGATRWRIIRQLLVEAVVISFTGCIVGVAASYWLAQLPMQLSPDSFPPESVIRINLPILAFSVALALLSGMLFGLAPALRLSRPDLSRALPANLRGLAAAPGKHRWSALIAAQVALTLLLMATAGTAIRSFLRLTQVTLGYNPDHVLQAGIVMHFRDPQSWHGIQSRESRTVFIEQIKQKIAAIHGITAVAISAGNATPPYSGVEAGFESLGGNRPKSEQARGYAVSPDYFATLQIPLLRGRIWNSEENARGDFVAVVNQSFVRRYWPNSDPLSHQLRIPDLHAVGPFDAVSAHSTGWRQIVGVVGDARNDGVDLPVQPAIYFPYTAMMPPFAQFLIRTQGEPLSYLHSIRAAVASVAPDQQISNGTFTLNEAIERDSQYSRQRLFSILFGVFSAMALALALAGIFSVVAYSVAQRTTEFGVRLALGASRTHILWVAARIALVSTVTGVAVGLVLDSFLGTILAAWMHNAFAATGLITAAALLILSALIACLLPASRATNVPPAEALRYE
jgi:predicted permease